MDELFNYLNQFHKFSPDEEEIIRASVSMRRVGNGDFVLEKGEVPRELVFVADGALRAGQYSPDGEEVIRYFVDRRNFATDVHTFLQGSPSAECLRAVLDSTLIIFPRDRYRKLSACVPLWNEVMDQVTASTLLDRMTKRAPISGYDARTKYVVFESRYPTLSGRIPKSYIASYLGLTPATLSRIRSSLKRAGGLP